MTDKASSFLQMIRRDRRGRLKVYLGYVAGVGKTCQMLQEGQRLHEEGEDVVIGVVETHGRAGTSILVKGLEQIPLQQISYRGTLMEEMDVQAILSRQPKVVLVDELAHTTVPGSRNAKRYQDVQDLLAAGINVISTLNVQHLESLYDTVEQATHVKVRERIPDSVLADADQIVNVDVSPEDLQKRLQSGKIYPMDRVPTALANFFRLSQLEQLRELTLRELAAQIDSKRRETTLEKNLGHTDQVMVCLNERGPENAALLRHGSRLAGRLNRNWYAVHVQTLAHDPVLGDAMQQRLMADMLALANQLGATVFTFKGEDIVDTLLRFAKEYHAGYIIIGKPRPKPWWKIWLRKNSVAERLLNEGQGLILMVVDTLFTKPIKEIELAPTLASSRAPGQIQLNEILPVNSIVIWDYPLSKEQAISELTQTLISQNIELETHAVITKILEREKQGSTFLNEGIALPHARIENLKKPLVAFGLCRHGILDANTQTPIEVVFLLLSPKDGHKSHLQLLSIASRLIQNAALRKKLQRAKNGQGILDTISDWERNPE